MVSLFFIILKGNIHMDIQWFPGHMARTKRKIQENLKLIDIIAEIVDARIPISSRNPDLDHLITSKPRIIILNKSDMADPMQTRLWVDYFNRLSITSLESNCKTGAGMNKFLPTVKSILHSKIQAWNSKGMVGRNVKIMIVGIPNVGKSSFINRLAPKAKAKTADKPGVTRGNQWFAIDKGIDLLDTPGVLWPKFNDESTGLKLAFTGAIKDQILDIESLAVKLIDFLIPKYENNLTQRFKLHDINLTNMSAYDILKSIGKNRGMLISKGEIDTERASIMLLDEFREAKLGKITLERPEQYG